MKTTFIRFSQLFLTCVSLTVLTNCRSPKEQPKSPAHQKAGDSDDYSEDEVKDSPEWR